MSAAEGVYCVIWKEHLFFLSCIPSSPSSVFCHLNDRNIATFLNLMPANTFPPAPGGFFFAKPMRENKYVTMMDPFQQKYGNVLSSALIFPALVADVLWVARTLVSLGKLLHTVKLFGTVMCSHTYLCNHTSTNRTTDPGT